MVIKHAGELDMLASDHNAKLESEREKLTKMWESKLLYSENDSKKHISDLSKSLTDLQLEHNEFIKKYECEVEIYEKKINSFGNKIESSDDPANFEENQDEIRKEFDIISSGSGGENDNPTAGGSREDSIEEIAEEYVVLAIQKSLEDMPEGSLRDFFPKVEESPKHKSSPRRNKSPQVSKNRLTKPNEIS